MTGVVSPAYAIAIDIGVREGVIGLLVDGLLWLLLPGVKAMGGTPSMHPCSPAS